MPDEEGAAIVRRARQLVGVPFRPQGRSPTIGLDCIGTAALACGLPLECVRGDYRIRGANRQRLEDELARFFRPVPLAETGDGDLIIVEPGRGQLHVLLLTDRGYVHADVSLRRVVEVPGPIRWHALSAWRLLEKH